MQSNELHGKGNIAQSTTYCLFVLFIVLNEALSKSLMTFKIAETQFLIANFIENITGSTHTLINNSDNNHE